MLGYAFKNFVYEVRRYNDPVMSINATLTYRGNFVATVAGTHIPKLGLTGGRRPSLQFVEVDEFAFEQLRKRLEGWRPTDGFGNVFDPEDRLFILVLRLCQAGYWHRRAMQLSLKHTVYRLLGDPEGEFRFLRNQPLTADAAAGLRHAFGPRLHWIYRCEDLPAPQMLFEDVPAAGSEASDGASKRVPAVAV